LSSPSLKEGEDIGGGGEFTPEEDTSEKICYQSGWIVHKMYFKLCVLFLQNIHDRRIFAKFFLFWIEAQVLKQGTKTGSSISSVYLGKTRSEVI